MVLTYLLAAPARVLFALRQVISAARQKSTGGRHINQIGRHPGNGYQFSLVAGFSQTGHAFEQTDGIGMPGMGKDIFEGPDSTTRPAYMT